jgi:hypothetical protein
MASVKLFIVTVFERSVFASPGIFYASCSVPCSCCPYQSEVKVKHLVTLILKVAYIFPEHSPGVDSWLSDAVMQVSSSQDGAYIFSAP